MSRRELIHEFEYNPFGTEYDFEKVYRLEDGRLMLFGENVSNHPWKRREHSEQFVRVISREELEEAIRKEREVAEEKRRKYEQEEKERKEWFEWVERLKKAGLPVNSWGEVVDDWENPLFRLPRELVGMSPEEVSKWIDEHYEEYVSDFDFFD